VYPVRAVVENLKFILTYRGKQHRAIRRLASTYTRVPIPNHPRYRWDAFDCGEFPRRFWNDAFRSLSCFSASSRRCFRDSISSELFGRCNDGRYGGSGKLGELHSFAANNGDESTAGKLLAVRADSGHRRNCRRMRGAIPVPTHSTAGFVERRKLPL